MGHRKTGWQPGEAAFGLGGERAANYSPGEPRRGSPGGPIRSVGGGDRAAESGQNDREAARAAARGGERWKPVQGS